MQSRVDFAKGAGAALLLALALSAFAHEGPTPNRVDVSAKLSTSGQPTKAFLETLKEQGYEAVVYLAPPTVGDAIADEPKIVGRQGIVYVNVPIVWERPTAADFDAFTRVMTALENRKVWVHCQMNLRASSMVFLHRVVTLKEPPEKAWADVQKAWVPNPTWKAFILATLKANGVGFEPL
jgi:protein tyrosine phosphatase (PTP) superfamily phosphohydrolase (DUF442 family)